MLEDNVDGLREEIVKMDRNLRRTQEEYDRAAESASYLHQQLEAKEACVLNTQQKYGCVLAAFLRAFRVSVRPRDKGKGAHLP